MPEISTKKQSYLAGAAIISLGGFISKLIGALYRIPLANILGSEGMGIYQMVYPLYCMLLTVAASGIPSGIARLVASGRENGVAHTSFLLFGFMGAAGSLIMFMAAGPLAYFQGEATVELCCRLLSPAVFFVAIISVVRGYFQGRRNMIPTALTEISEQAVKVAFGCALAFVNRHNLSAAVASTLAAVTLSEFVSALFALKMYFSHRPAQPLYKVKNVGYKSILAYTVPLTFSAMAIPLSQLAESIAAVNIMRDGGLNATALYGIYSGCAVTIINLPVSVAYGLAAASIPRISPYAAKGDLITAKQKSLKSLLITIAVSLPMAVAVYAFAPLASKIIFRSLDNSQTNLLINLVRIMAVNAVTLSVMQTSSACLTSLGHPVKSAVTQWITSFLRVVTDIVLLKFTTFSVISLALSADCAYLVAVLLNIWYIIRVKENKGGTYEDNSYRSGIKGRGT